MTTKFTLKNDALPKTIHTTLLYIRDGALIDEITKTVYQFSEIEVLETTVEQIAIIFSCWQGDFLKEEDHQKIYNFIPICEHEMVHTYNNDATDFSNDHVSFVFECNKIGCSHTEEVVLEVPDTLEQAKALAEYQKLGMVTLKHNYCTSAGDRETEHYTFLTALTGKQLENMSDEQIAEHFEIEYEEGEYLEYTYYPHPPIK